MEKIEYVKQKEKFAYLIIAHQNLKQLQFLISLLDHKRNDIYILFDGKFLVNNKDKQLLKDTLKFSNIFFTKSINIYWGSYSQIEAEMILFTEAYKKVYQHYHLISGSDLPLLPQEDFHKYLDKNLDYSFISLNSNYEIYEEEILNRIRYYHFFDKITPRSLPGVLGKVVFKSYRYLEIKIQKILGIDLIKKNNLMPVKASNWLTLSNECVHIIVENADMIEKCFKYSFLGDELFIPTVLFKLGKQKLIKYNKINTGRKNEFQGNLRFINWWDGYPYEWTDSEKDLEQITMAAKQGYFFSRKFDLKKYPKIKLQIEELLKRKY